MAVAGVVVLVVLVFGAIFVTVGGTAVAGCLGVGMEVDIKGSRVDARTFVSPGSAPDEMLSSGSLIQHQSVNAPGS